MLFQGKQLIKLKPFWERRGAVNWLNQQNTSCHKVQICMLKHFIAWPLHLNGGIFRLVQKLKLKLLTSSLFHLLYLIWSIIGKLYSQLLYCPQSRNRDGWQIVCTVLVPKPNCNNPTHPRSPLHVVEWMNMHFQFSVFQPLFCVLINPHPGLEMQCLVYECVTRFNI